MLLNIMFHAPMGRFKLDQIFELPLISFLTVVPFNCCINSCRPFVVITSSAGLVGCRGFYCHSVSAVDHWSSNRCNNNERPTGMNTKIQWDGGEN